MDGVLDVWDILYRQNAPAYSHKVADHPLSCISVQGTAQAGGGRLLAIGDVNGTVSLLEVSENLAVPPPSEKVGISAMFDRESKREENLEKRAIALARAAKAAGAKGGAAAAAGAGGAGGAGSSDEAAAERNDEMDETLRKVDSEFMTLIKEAEEAESKTEASAAAAAAAAAGAGAVGPQGSVSSTDGKGAE
jgi:dynein intermediate chain 2, axonemal